jgi:hypothetical protein
MQKMVGIAIICLGLYFGYGVYFEYNRYSATNTLTEGLESISASKGDYAAASYLRDSRQSPSWPKMILFGIGALGCLGLGSALLADKKK